MVCLNFFPCDFYHPILFFSALMEFDSVCSICISTIVTYLPWWLTVCSPFQGIYKKFILKWKLHCKARNIAFRVLFLTLKKFISLIGFFSPILSIWMDNFSLKELGPKHTLTIFIKHIYYTANIVFIYPILVTWASTCAVFASALYCQNFLIDFFLLNNTFL